MRRAVAVAPLARFALTARVLSRSDYRFDAGADITPTDLVLGWGRMRWRSSLSRGDTGGGSCELIWVESLTLGNAL